MPAAHPLLVGQQESPEEIPVEGDVVTSLVIDSDPEILGGTLSSSGLGCRSVT